MTIQLQENIKPTTIKKGFRQGDDISSKLFTLKDIFRALEWANMEINIDDVVIIATIYEELQTKLMELAKKSVKLV